MLKEHQQSEFQRLLRIELMFGHPLHIHSDRQILQGINIETNTSISSSLWRGSSRERPPDLFEANPILEHLFTPVL